MKENNIKKLYADRLANKPVKPAKTKAILKSAYSESLDFNLDQPDAMPDIFVLEKLYHEASKWENRGYNNKANEHFNSCVEAYLNDHFNVRKLDRFEEISVTNGIAPVLNALCLAFINPADGVLTTKPTVAPIETMAEWLGGTILTMPITAKNKNFPKYEDIPQKSLKKAKLLYLNYPNNPTGASATLEFFKETVDFARINNLIVVHDASYADLVYEEGRQLSFLSIEGAKKVGVEIYSFSYSHNMAGFGVGFIAGNKNVIKAVRDVTERSGLGQYVPVQHAAAYALAQTDTARVTARKYEKRMSLLCCELKKVGFKFVKPDAGFYLFVKAPKEVENGLKFDSPWDFEMFLRANNILVKSFDDGIRFSVTFSAFGEQEERKVTSELYNRLKEYKFVF